MISQVLIAKNEERCIARCLESGKAAGVAEQIVVDTGSTDNTVQIATEHGATVYNFEWINDYAAAKNFALSKANPKSDWIMFLDADEWWDEKTVSNLQQVLKAAKSQKGLSVNCLLWNVKLDGSIINNARQVRIFRNFKQIKYEGAIHEKINVDSESVFLTNDIQILHDGYDPEIMGDKGKIEFHTQTYWDKLKKATTPSEKVETISMLLQILDPTKESKVVMQLARQSLEILSHYNKTEMTLFFAKRDYLSMVAACQGAGLTAQDQLQIIKDFFLMDDKDPDAMFLMAEALCRKQNRDALAQGMHLCIQCLERLKNPDLEHEMVLVIRMKDRLLELIKESKQKILKIEDFEKRQQELKPY